MSDTIKLKIQNFPAQQKIFSSEARYKIAVKGRRFGLTRGAANDFIKSAINREFKSGIWVDTVNQNIDRYVDRYFIPHLKNLPKSWWQWKKQAKVLHMLDSYIDFRSSDRPENIEGFGYQKGFLNEAGIILKSEYLWHNAIMPMLLEYKNTSVVIGGTPKGPGVFQDLARRGKDKNQKDYDYFHFTSFDNPYLDRELLQSEINKAPEMIARQEYYAEFLDEFGAVFRNTKDVAVARPAKPIEGHMYVMGVDLAKHQDYTVIVVYDRATNHQVYQERFNKLEWYFQKSKIIKTAAHYNDALVYLDATGVGDPIADDLLRAGVAVEPVKFTNTIKKELIEKTVIWFEQFKCRILNIPESIEEFTNFTYDVSSTGRMRYNAPEGFHDDIVIAHALAISGLEPTIRNEPKRKESKIRESYIKRIKDYQTQEDLEEDYAYL